MTEAYVCHKCFGTFYYEDEFSPFPPVVLKIPRERIYNRRDGKNFIGSMLGSQPSLITFYVCPSCFTEIYDNSGLKARWQEGYEGPK